MPTPASPVVDLGERSAAPQPRGLLPKKCRYCERRFSKAEHLKRHQRSHTGERPYTCPRCKKSFSRSDVLIRHLKNHPQIVGEEGEKDSSEGETIEVNGSTSNGAKPSSRGAAAPPQGQRRVSMIDPALVPPLQGHENPHAYHSGLDHLALLASRQSWGNGSMDAVMANSNHHGLPEMSHPPSWNLEMSATHHASGIDPNLDPRLAQSDSEFRQMDRSTVNTPRFSFGGDLYSERMGGMPGQITPGMGEMGGDVSIMPQDLQTWFDQFELDSQIQPSSASLPAYDSNHVSQDRRSSLASENHSVRNPSSPSTLIPNERFAKVERCWPNRQSNPLRLMPTLWADVAMKAEDNLFSNGNLSPEAMEQNRQCGSRWGLDEDCRERLQRMFVSMTPVVGDQTVAAFGSPLPENLSSPSDSRSLNGAPSVVVDPPSNFPPAEIFDIGLDLYFRQFHPLQPFIHTPTFCPKTAPTSLLFTMCLIGLTILQTKGATAFVKQTFSKALEQVSTELNPGLLHEGRRIDQLYSVASAILLLNLSEMTGSQVHQSQCQMLYTNLITTASRHGLFNAGESPPLNDAFFAQIPDLESRWKAWSRIECVKRLVVSLTMVDTWYSAMLHTSPIMQTENIQIVLPCDGALFTAASPQKWSQLAATTHLLCMPTFALSPTTATFPSLQPTVEPLGIHGILSICRLRISTHFHRLLSGQSIRASSQSFIPALSFALDPAASSTPGLVVSVITHYAPLFAAINPNCLVLWHNMNIMLCSDIRLFETGAGCVGAEAAHQALDDIAVWTATPSARRACLHAAQTFKLMSNRRASDGDPFHASSGLFLSALILGLYVFMAAPQPDPTPLSPTSSFDLTDEVDWVAVGLTGLTPPASSAVPESGNEDPAMKFIIDGGAIVFDGVVHRPGYEAARRILLDYARLLEDIGRWRARVNQFSKVLRIMSDALVDVEMGGQ